LVETFDFFLTGAELLKIKQALDRHSLHKYENSSETGCSLQKTYFEKAFNLTFKTIELMLKRFKAYANIPTALT